MADESKNGLCEGDLLSTILKELRQVMREELTAQKQELLFALSNELDGIANKVIVSSILPPLHRLLKDMDNDSGEEPVTNGAESNDGHITDDRSSSEVSEEDANGKCDLPTPNSYEAQARKVSQHSETIQEVSIAQKILKSQSSRSPSVVQKLVLDAQLAEMTNRPGQSWGEKDFQWKLGMCLHSKLAEKVLAVLIVMNASMFGLQADFAIQEPHSDPPKYFALVELFFIIVFSCELCLRVLVDGRDFFSCQHPLFTWNCLDFLLVAQAYAEIILAYSVNLTSARMLRMLRMVRMLKILRFMRDMRHMVLSILGSLWPLIWAMVLLFLIIYTFAILLVQLIENEMAELHSLPHYSSLYRFMFSLFMCISGGISWVEVIDPIWHVHPAISPLFGIYISFTVFCVLNIVTGFFCEQASRMSKEDEENMMFEEVRARKKWTTDVEAVFQEIDKTGDDELSLDEFVIALSDLRLQTAMKTCGVDIMNANLLSVFNMLDFDKSGKIDVSEFVYGLKHLHGDAKAIDMARLKHEIRNLHSKLDKLNKIQEGVEKLSLGCTKKPRSLAGIIEKPISSERGNALFAEQTHVNICTAGSDLPLPPVQPLPALPTLQPTPATEGKQKVGTRLMPVTASRVIGIQGSRV